MSGAAGWIGVDLDGTLAHYEGWKGEGHIGAPIPAMVERVKGWLADGKDVRIFTARIAVPSDLLPGVEDPIRAWCLEHLGAELPITNVKDFAMVELWDDRAVQVVPNTGARAALLETGNAKPGSQMVLVHVQDGVTVAHVEFSGAEALSPLLPLQDAWVRWLMPALAALRNLAASGSVSASIGT